MLKLSIFLDTFNETNGVSIFYKNYYKWNEEFKKTKTIIFSIADKDVHIVGINTQIFLSKPYFKK
ncbi:MAG: hypothetical protein ACYCXQ_11800 [Candidatus Humimicrobiaceae bacterium]